MRNKVNTKINGARKLTEGEMYKLLENTAVAEVHLPYKIGGMVDWKTFDEAKKKLAVNDIVVFRVRYGDGTIEHVSGLFKSYVGGMVNISASFADKSDTTLSDFLIEGILKLGNIKSHIVKPKQK